MAHRQIWILPILLLATLHASAEPNATLDVCGEHRGKTLTLENLRRLELMDSPNPNSDLEIDLTGDEKKEYLRAHYCGNASCNFIIFRNIDGEMYECSGDVSLHPKGFTRLVESHKGFKDLIIYSRLNSESGGLARLEFNGTRYTTVHVLKGQAKDLSPFVGK